MDDADATRSLAPVVDTGMTAPVEAGERFVDDPEEYTVSTPIGAGGMGTVLAATGARLGRQVALKVVNSDRDDLRRRFEREALVTARLQHPAIVPVYGSGRGRKGQPFYVMKCVTGEPLDKAVAMATSYAQRIALLPNVIAVADAIAYAHAEHVVHRDLKPANVLVGAFGETVVIDWGLAKDVTDADESIAPSRATSDRTAVGNVIGTPAYMPLEQARGDGVDERADVYALGAILYHVLAGAPPYARTGERGVPWETMLARVLTDEPAALASLAPDAPPDLLAIVARAMARSPAHRYPSARELAADLRRFQTGQLVGAHRYSTWQLARRWLRRHRAPVAVGAALVVVLAVVSAFSIQRIREERSDAEEARAVAEEQRGLAVANRDDAEDLVGFMVGDLKDRLTAVGKLEILDAVAKRTKAYYDHQPEARSNADRRKRAQAFVNLGDLLQAQGHLDTALEAYRTAVAFRETVASTPGSPDDRADLATARYKIGDVMTFRSDREAALDAYRSGVAVAEQAASGDPTSRSIQDRVATGHCDLGDILVERGDVANAITEYRTSLRIRSEIVAAEPANEPSLRNFSACRTGLADALASRGDLDGATSEYRASMTLREKLVALAPSNVEYKRRLTAGMNGIASVLITQGRLAEAVSEYRAGLANAEQVSAFDPANTLWLRDILVEHTKLGNVLARSGDHAGALVEMRAGAAVAERLVGIDPANAYWRSDLMKAHGDIGNELESSGDHDGALVELRKGVAIGEELVKADPHNVRLVSELAFLHLRIGTVLTETGTSNNLGDAVGELQAAVDLYRQLVAGDPDNIENQGALAQSLVMVGHAYAARGDSQAEAWCRQATAALDELASKHPSDMRFILAQVGGHVYLGDVLSGSNRDLATAEYLAARRIVDAWLKDHPGDRNALDRRTAIDQRLSK